MIKFISNEKAGRVRYKLFQEDLQKKRGGGEGYFENRGLSLLKGVWVWPNMTILVKQIKPVKQLAPIKMPKLKTSKTGKAGEMSKISDMPSTSKTYQTN